MQKLFGAAILILLVQSLFAQPLRFYDKADSVKYTALNVVADDKGGWLTLGSSEDSSFTITQFDYCGKVVVNEKYPLPLQTKLNTPVLNYLGKDTLLVAATLNSTSGSQILLFYSVSGIIRQARLISALSSSLSYNPVVSILDNDHILLAFNYDTGRLAKSGILMLDKNFNQRWARRIETESHIQWIHMISANEFVIGDGLEIRKYDTLGVNFWSRSFKDHRMVYNSMVRKDSALVFLTDYIDPVVDTVKKFKYKQVINIDLAGRFKWNSDRIRSMQANHLLEYNSRLFLGNDGNYIFNGIDTLPQDSIPYIFAHSLQDTTGNLVSSRAWSAKESLIDYKSSMLDDGNFAVCLSLGNSDTLNGLGNIKTSQLYEGACDTVDFSSTLGGSVIIDTPTLRNLPAFNVSVNNLNITGGPDSLKLSRVCEEFDLKDGTTPIPLCKGDSVFLSGITIPNATYVWDIGSNQQGIWVKEEGEYSVTITYCDKSATITYKVSFITFADKVITKEQCEYPFRLDALDQTSHPAKFFWESGDTTSFTTINGKGTYTVRVTECQMNYRITYNVVPQQFNDSVHRFMACDFPETLYANLGRTPFTGATYKWDNGSTNNERQISGPGTYVVTVSYCESSYTQTFIVSLFNFNDNTLSFDQCNYPDNLYGDLGRNFKNATYKWDNGSTSVSRQISGPGTYKVTVNYCQTTYVQTFVINSTVNYIDSTAKFPNCIYPNSYHANLGRTFTDATFKWENGSTEGALKVNKPGTHKVTITYCGGKTVVHTLNIEGRPISDKTFTLDSSCSGFLREFELKSGFEYANDADSPPSYKWIMGSSSTNESIMVNKPGVYIVEIKYCADTVEYKHDVRLKDEDYLLYPNVFPPNSEVKINQLFLPVVKDTISEYNLKIFNRWGQKVFETSDPTEGWKGDHDKSGSPAPMDTYMYIATVTTPCGTSKVKKGTVTLIR
jgi:gliding motility-associated-like protein